MSIKPRGDLQRRTLPRSHPGVVIIAGFLALSAIGGALLALPLSQTDSASMTAGDALFTSVSAVTVTGLVVHDTATAWTTFGQVVILVLIQIGGLGIMTLAGFMGLVVSRRMSVRAGMLAGTEIGLTHLGPLRPLVRSLVKFVFISEAVLTVALASRFLIGTSGATEGEIARPIFDGLFHAISAFNNAGFSTIGGGLESYVDDWFVSLVIAGGFIVGGLGFPVIFELARQWQAPRIWSLHTKVSLTFTVMLLVGGTAMIALLEWGNEQTLGALDPVDRLLAAFFQSATARTAGFNTLSIDSLHPSTWLVLVLLMVIGANSASTGGGIKTTTVAVALQAAYGQLRGDRDVTIFGRRIPTRIQQQALALVVVALGTVGTAAFLLAVVEPDIPAVELLFEAASAFGTVGLSTSVTPSLGTLGRFIVIVLMFVGRVGPITFGTAFLFRAETQRFRFPEDDLMVG
ncbi:MAG: potassium transporter TrkG [Acidimicrobiales bacterium]